MRYVSLFSGIEAASVAWRPLGWKALAFAEIEPFPCAVLAERFPDVPNLGDVCEVDWSSYRGADVVVGGSPCQAFSIAGNRGGLDDPRGRLMFEFIRAVRDIGPRWVVWENVPGVLSQDGGRAFGSLIWGLAQCGLHLAWRVLDAQFYGVAQRRRRVFLIGSPDPGRSAAVLFEPGSVRGSSGESRAKREALTRAAGKRAQGEGPEPVAFKHFMGGKAHGIGYCEGVSPTLTDSSAHQPAVALTQFGETAGTLTARYDSSPCADRGQNIVCMADTQANTSIDTDVAGTVTRHSHKDPPVVSYAVRMREDKPGGGKGPLVSEDVSLTLATGSDQTLFHEDAEGWTVRRLTPLECERLQGFPDDWTAIPGAKDGPRYKAIGNSMAVPVMRWIGSRIEEVEAIA